jgi:hypothetical protein
MRKPSHFSGRVTRRSLLAAPLSARPRRGLFRGTFLQPWSRHLEWAPEQWENLLDALSALGCEELILQWCRYDEIDYGPLATRLLDGARARRMRLTVGLPYRGAWWQDIAADAAQALGGLAARVREFASSAESRLWRRHPAFGGWYLPEEIDDDHWFAAPRRRMLAGMLDRAVGSLQPLAVSGFTNRTHPASDVAAFWQELAARRRLARVLFQDGIGAGKMTLAAWPAYLEELRARLGKRLDVVVEIFEARAGEPGFQAVPAPLERIERQAELARRATGRSPLCFSLPDYAWPQAGAAAAALYEALAAFSRQP